MTTLDERIEAMATCWWLGKELDQDQRPIILSAMRQLAVAFAPELFSVPPTGWIAPTVLTEDDEPAVDLQFDIQSWYERVQSNYPMKTEEGNGAANKQAGG